MFFQAHDGMAVIMASVFLASVEASSFQHQQYSNPCHEFGTANKLNNLYYDTPPTDGCPGTGLPSFRCSGVLIHFADHGAGRPVPDPEDWSYKVAGAGSAVFQGKNSFLKIPLNFSIGMSTLASASCPVDMIDGGEYPYFCPNAKGISLGALSFNYLRSDIALPVSWLREYDETGINSYTNASAKPSVLYANGHGTGYIFLPEASNPDVVLPENANSFWDNRFGKAWPHDGTTNGRVNCGNGAQIFQLALGLGGGPQVNPATDVIIQCPPDSPHWSKWALPPTWEDYCPESVFSSSDAYYNYTQQVWEEFTNNVLTGVYDPNRTLVKEQEYTGPYQPACGIPATKFDEVFIPAVKFENWSKTGQFRRTLWNEVTLKPWHGMGLNQLGAHIVFFAVAGTEGSEAEALQHAAD